MRNLMPLNASAVVHFVGVSWIFLRHVDPSQATQIHHHHYKSAANDVISATVFAINLR